MLKHMFMMKQNFKLSMINQRQQAHNTILFARVYNIRTSMYKNFTAKCIRGHEIEKMCVRKTCPHPSLICCDQSCEFSSKHRKCKMTCSAEILFDAYKKRGLKYQKLTNQITRFYDYMLDKVKMEKINMIEYFKNPADNIKDSQDLKLFRLMTRGPTDSISPLMVSQVMESFSTETSDIIEEKKNQMRQKMKDMAIEIRDSLLKVKSMWIKDQTQQNAQKIDFVFDQLRSHNDIVISNYGKASKCKENLNRIAQIFPSDPTQKLTSKTQIQIKVITCCQGICFGMGNSAKIEKNHFQWKDGEGLYLVNGFNGAIYNKFDCQSKKQSSLKISQGDKFTMEFDPNKCLLRITHNKNSCILKLNQEELKELCFVVMLSNPGDQVQIV